MSAPQVSRDTISQPSDDAPSWARTLASSAANAVDRIVTWAQRLPFDTNNNLRWNRSLLDATVTINGKTSQTWHVNGDVRVGLTGATAMTAGFPYLPGANGAPTGVPTTYSGWYPLYIDQAASVMKGYWGGAWHALDGAIATTYPRQHTYAYSATVTVDAGIYDVVDITLTGNLTLAFTNGVDGKAIMVRLRQDGTGSRLVTLGTGIRLSADLTSFTASTTASRLDWLLFRYTSADSKYDLLAYNRGF